MRRLWRHRWLAVAGWGLSLATVGGAAQDGVAIAADVELFSAGFRAEFREMNEMFPEFGFEIDLREGEQPTLGAITAKYGDPDDTDDILVVLGFGADERRVTLTFSYYGIVGFGVVPDDPEQTVLRVRRLPE